MEPTGKCRQADRSFVDRSFARSLGPFVRAIGRQDEISMALADTYRDEGATSSQRAALRPLAKTPALIINS